MINDRPLPDCNQNFWSLACIQTASFGVPIIIWGGQLAKQYGAGNTIGSICVGNFLVWLLSLIIISMTYRERANSLQIVNNYLGKEGTFLAAFCLIFAVISWYIMQLKTSTTAINTIFKIPEGNMETFALKTGVAIGLLATLVTIGGIRLIKWLNVICLPILFFYIIYSFFSSENTVKFKGTWGLSLSAITTVIFFQLPGIINLPTFFRHSRSLTHSFLALTVMTVLLCILEIFSIWVGFDGSLNIAFGKFNSSSLFPVILIISFIVLLTICTEIVNIYFAIACLEIYLPRFANAKGTIIIGLAGTAVFTFFQITYPVQLSWNLSNYFFASLGIVLLINFIVQSVIKRKPRTIGKLIGNVSWIAGCAIALILELQQKNNPFLISISTSALIFIFALFFGETIWYIRNYLKRHLY